MTSLVVCMTTSDITIDGVLVVTRRGDNQENSLVLEPVGERYSPTNSIRRPFLQPDPAGLRAGECLSNYMREIATSLVYDFLEVGGCCSVIEQLRNTE